MPFALSTLFTGAETGMHCPSQAPGAQGGGLTLTVSGQMNNCLLQRGTTMRAERGTRVWGNAQRGVKPPGRRSWDMNLGVLCHHGADVLRGRLPLLLPQLCFGSVDRCLKPLLALCSPIPTWLKAGSPHSTPPSIHSHQLVYSWVFTPTF